MTVRTLKHKFQADFMYKGVRYRESFDSHKEAQDYQDSTLLSLKQGKTPAPPKSNKQRKDLSKLGPLYKHVVRTHWELLPGSQSAINYGRQIVDYFGSNKSVPEITLMDLQEVCSHFFENGNSNATVNRKLAAISKMLTEAKKHGVIDEKPEIPRTKEMNKEIRYMTISEEDATVERFKHLGLDYWAEFTVVAVDTGCRLGELLGLRWSHFSEDFETVHIWQSKSNKSRTLFLTKRATDVLKGIQERKPDTSGPFDHMRCGRSLKRSVREQWHLGSPDKRIHDMRHTCASRMVQRGVDLLRVKDWLGHETIDTTLRYAHLAPTNLMECRKALERPLA